MTTTKMFMVELIWTRCSTVDKIVVGACLLYTVTVCGHVLLSWCWAILTLVENYTKMVAQDIFTSHNWLYPGAESETKVWIPDNYAAISDAVACSLTCRVRNFGVPIQMSQLLLVAVATWNRNLKSVLQGFRHATIYIDSHASINNVDGQLVN